MHTERVRIVYHMYQLPYQVVFDGGKPPDVYRREVSFSCAETAIGFLTSLDVDVAFWRRHLPLQAFQTVEQRYRLSGRGDGAYLLYVVAPYVASGRVRFYSLALPEEQGYGLRGPKHTIFRFVRASEQSQSLMNKCSRVPIPTRKAAEALLASLADDEKAWQAVLEQNNLRSPKTLPAGGEAAAQNQVVDALVTGDVHVYEMPAPRPQKTQAAEELEPATGPGYRPVPPPPTQPKPAPPALAERKGVPPQSLDDAATRLASMADVIDTQGYQPKYSDAELLAQAHTGAVANERYHVRFMEKDYQWAYGSKDKSPDNLTGALGREMQGTSGKGPKYWSTTFDQIEDADTDPKLISEKLGLDYKPDQNYVLLVIDTEAAIPLTGLASVAATFTNVSAFANRELPREFPEDFTEQTMNEAFQAQYAAHYQQAVERGHLKDQWSTDTKKFKAHLDTTALSEQDKKLMLKRMEMHREVGNNQHYKGNGLTKDTNPFSDNRYGVVETLNFERKQTNLQQLKQANAIKIIELS